LIGAGAGAVEGFVGYSVAMWMTGNWHKWDKRDALVAAGAGAVVGFISPWAALLPGGTSVVATLGIYGTINVAQYIVTEMIHHRKPTIEGVSITIITGVIGGAAVGMDTTIKNFSMLPPKLYVVNVKYAFKEFSELYKITCRNALAKLAWKNLFPANFARAVLGSIGSNMPSNSINDFWRFLQKQAKGI
jgi:hypothetical protein